MLSLKPRLSRQEKLAQGSVKEQKTMNNLFDMINGAQGGNAVDNLARQYGLSPDQAHGAIEALLPALSMGMQRQSQSVNGLEGLLQSFGGGQHNEFFDADGDGIPDNAVEGGNNVLAQLFGSKDVSRAVAQEASLMSGVSSTILKQMLPVIASMVMGGMFKSAMGNGLGGLVGQAMQGGLGGLLGSVLGGGQQQQQQQPQGGMLDNILGQMMGGGQRQQQQQQQQSGGLGDLLGGMLGGNRQAPPPPQQQGGLGDLLGGLLGGNRQAPPPPQQQSGGLGDLLGGMLGGSRQAPQQQQQSGGNISDMLSGMLGGGQQAQPPQTTDALSAGLDMLKGMFQTGKQTNQGYQNNLESIFDQYQMNRPTGQNSTN
jgi:hypothetical protein